MNHRTTGDWWKTNARPSTREKDRIQPTRKYSLDFSRHLCIDATQSAMMDRRHSKSFSDTEAVNLLRHLNPNGKDLATRRRTSIGQTHSIQRSLQGQVYCKDDKFQRKYSMKNDQVERLSATTSPVVSKRILSNPVGPLHFDEECARSFCDSVSSIACSTLKNVDEEAEYRKERKRSLSTKVSNIDAIESWLQGVSKALR
ncbi:uncharacterized protein LOC114964980 [Acropora millepora]|uniref:uncharacterized protein LOC114964980 n=1 Tax=Acropora millepora TaxID=45264 RepID=UPI0010FCB5A6|nr:uncharacterized protein LOC114964980 [Acropora millepora]